LGDALRLLVWSAAFIAINLALYAALRRHIAWFGSERGILFYQALSFVILIAGCLGTLLIDPSAQTLTGLIAAIALHGIYSLSFLELWSLAEGSYSLSILEHIEQTTRDGTEVDVHRLEALGGSKKTQRLAGLERLGLVRVTQDHVALTYRGAKIADALSAVTRSAGRK
jgi:hypothetical protein